MMGADGKPFGIFCPSYETTERVLSERRLHLLNTVASAIVESRSIEDAVDMAVAVAGSSAAS